jgi:UPF0271 protein
MRAIDLNADVGEWEQEGPASAIDAALIPQVTSVNVACGVHAGNESVMAATVTLARAHGAAIGAHPSLDDREHFGRREFAVTPGHVSTLVREQVAALIAIAAREGAVVRHVKPHGALYNMAARDATLAAAVAEAVAAIDRRLVLVGLAGSRLIEAGRKIRLTTASEGFADRGYDANGALLPRTAPGAIIDDPERVARRAVEMATTSSVETLCIHSDTPGAVELARRIRAALTAAGIQIRACSA